MSLKCPGGEILTCLGSEILYIFFEICVLVKYLKITIYMKESHERNAIYQAGLVRRAG